MGVMESGPGTDAMAAATLDDKYTLEHGHVFLTGIQALVRLPMLQQARDAAAGVNTAGFISGYRGSPLGGVDLAMWKAQRHLRAHHIVFQPGLNEDLAATAVWGSQQLNLFEGARYDGVFGMWYGKGPGVDRCGDVFRHANAAGTSRHGGVLVVAGDDHGAKSSTLPHQTEHVFKAVMMPVLEPADVQEYLDFGIHGWALSRFSGCWVAFKALADTVESSAIVEVDPERVNIALPTDIELPADGLNIRWPDPPLVQEKRLLHHKLYAALAYCRANSGVHGLNRMIIDPPQARLGIITTGKSYLDVRQALDDLGIDARHAAEIGIRLYKVGMVWPLESEGVRQFAGGLDEILVVEEKRQFLEYQLKEELYNWREDVRPRVIGKFDEKGEWAFEPGEHGKVWHGDWLLPAAGELTPAMIARVIAARIARFYTSTRIRERLAFLEAKERALARPREVIARTPHYCSGCPHNTSTRVPEGSRALAGIGCHYMATWISPATTRTFSQMGGEGVAWLGQAPFSDTRHVFANLGDGTYYHSGLLAIRAAVAALANPAAPQQTDGRRPAGITYKILFNDAVAMTGGQPVDGPLTVPMVAEQMRAEGVQDIVVVSDGTARGYQADDLPEGVPLRHRRELDAIQRELRDKPGVSVLIYDQTCAAEKRRRRKRGTYPDPALRPYINEAVCEGCGDCSDKSNCMSVVSVETEFGRKRRIDQSSCNKDYSCLEGFCPSFVTVHGGRPRRGKARDTADLAPLPEPALPPLAEPYGVLVTGVGGTGVVTIGALLGMAAHLEGKGVTVLDMAGLAQKGGAVWSHVRFAARQEALFATRIAAGEANLVLGCDLVVAASDDSLAKMQAGRTRVVANHDQAITSEFVRGFAAQARSGDVAADPDPQFPRRAMEAQLADAVGTDAADFIDASRLATALMGDAIYTNLFMLGYAWQKGLIPVSAAALRRAVELNATAVDANLAAFEWGRRAAHDRAGIEALAAPPPEAGLSASLDEAIERRLNHLTAYQNRAYAERYLKLVKHVRIAEQAVLPGSEALAEAVARGYHKLLAAKDEYEVARLYADPAFLQGVADTFEGDYRLQFHFAPPALSHAGAGETPPKRSFGPWMLPVLRLLAKLRWLRGTPLNPFAHSADRKLERALLSDYEGDVAAILACLQPHNHAIAVELASLPAQIRGYGPIRARYAAHAQQRRAELRQALSTGTPPQARHGATSVRQVPVMAG